MKTIYVLVITALRTIHGEDVNNLTAKQPSRSRVKLPSDTPKLFNIPKAGRRKRNTNPPSASLTELLREDTGTATTLKPIESPLITNKTQKAINTVMTEYYPIRVYPAPPAIPTEENRTVWPNIGAMRFPGEGRNSSNFSITLVGLCGYPPYNDRVACRKQNFSSDPLSECEDASGAVLFGILIGLAGAAIICVNSFIFVVVVKNSDMRTHYDLIKVSLAAADVIIGIMMFTVVIPNMIWIRNLSEDEVVKFSRNDVNTASAVAVGFLVILATQASLLHLCFMSIERFMTIRWSFWHIRRKTRSIVITIFGIWIVSIVTASAPAFFPQNFEYKFQPALLIHMMTMKPGAGSEALGLEGLIYTLVTFVLPYVVMVVACILTGIVSYRKLRSTQQLFEKDRAVARPRNPENTSSEIGNNRTSPAPPGRENSIRPEIAVFITIIIMISAFTMTLVPFGIVVGLFTTGFLDCGNYTIPYATAFYFTLLNSLVNGIIYSARDPRFRVAVKRLICKDVTTRSRSKVTLNLSHRT